MSNDRHPTASHRAGVLPGQLHLFTEDGGPVAARRNDRARFQIRFHQTPRRSHLLRSCILEEHFELKRVHELQFAQRRVADGLALNVRDDLALSASG